MRTGAAPSPLWGGLGWGENLRRLRVFPLPDPPHKGDGTDWAQAQKSCKTLTGPASLLRSFDQPRGIARHSVHLEIDPVARLAGAPVGHFEIEAPKNLARFIAEKGSVALNGTSLTVNKVEKNIFTILLIPHTLEVTNWGARKAGDRIMSS